jgi:hypothetical protein
LFYAKETAISVLSRLELVAKYNRIESWLDENPRPSTGGEDVKSLQILALGNSVTAVEAVAIEVRSPHYIA